MGAALLSALPRSHLLCPIVASGSLSLSSPSPHPILWPRLPVGSLAPVLPSSPLGVRGWFPQACVDNCFVSD